MTATEGQDQTDNHPHQGQTHDQAQGRGQAKKTGASRPPSKCWLRPRSR